jgi:hypothetical protein
VAVNYPPFRAKRSSLSAKRVIGKYDRASFLGPRWERLVNAAIRGKPQSLPLFLFGIHVAWRRRMQIAIVSGLQSFRARKPASKFNSLGIESEIHARGVEYREIVLRVF